MKNKQRKMDKINENIFKKNAHTIVPKYPKMYNTKSIHDT